MIWYGRPNKRSAGLVHPWPWSSALVSTTRGLDGLFP